MKMSIKSEVFIYYFIDLQQGRSLTNIDINIYYIHNTMMQVILWKTDCMNAWFATEVFCPSSILSPGVDHDVLSDL